MPKSKKQAPATFAGRHYTRQFTTEGTHPFHGIERSTRTVTITKKPDDKVVFHREGVEAPAAWSDLAVTICASKYFALNHENSVFDMVWGVATSISAAGSRNGYFADADAMYAFRDDLAWLIIHQYGTFNSPVWFNVRLFDQHRMTGTGANWAFDKATGTYAKQKTAYERPQASACFILPLKDSLVGLNGIADTVKAETLIFRGGSGSGINYGRLREKNAPISSGKTSSGMMSFLKTFDTNAGSMKSGGTTRRAARMACCDVDHPDILEFIRWKAKEEKKAQALIAAGYAGEMEGEAYETVSGQNANNSVRVTDAFLRAVVADGPWELKSRVGGRVTATVPAKGIFREIAKAAWECGDPGLQYDDTINAAHTCANTDRIYASNPCSEFMFLDNSACNLASLRLTKFYVDGRFDVDAYMNTCRVFLLAQEILVDYASYPTKGLAKGSHDYRPLGLGYADLGTLVGQMGLAYDSDGGRAVAGALTSLMTGSAYEESALLAYEHGPFPGFAKNREPTLAVLKMHSDAHGALEDNFSTGLLRGGPEATILTLARILDRARSVWKNVLINAGQYGVRNAQVTLLAPTGTIGFKLDAATTGVEPQLGHVLSKKLAGGGTMKIVNPAIRSTLANLGYDEISAALIEGYILEHGNVSPAAPGFKPEHVSIFDTAIPTGPEQRSIPAEAHLLMMAAVQPFLSGAISKTVNMAASSTVEDVERVYLKGWELGLKAVAIYRDGAKQSQPVAVTDNPLAKAARDLKAAAEVLDGAATHADLDKFLVTGPVKLASEVVQSVAALPQLQRKLPPIRRGYTYSLSLGGQKFFLRTGEYKDGTLGEIFVDIAKEGSTLGGTMESWAICFSLGLQYGVPLRRLVDQYLHTQFEPSGPVGKHPTIRRASSLVDLVVRCLGVSYLGMTELQHVTDAEAEEAAPRDVIAAPANPAYVSRAPVSGKTCHVCGHIAVPNGNCHRCLNCGESLGCS